MTLTVKQNVLLQRIQQFTFDDGPVDLPFHVRLARDNGWSAGYTARAITEYRRFAFIAATAGHPVSPSDPVDQVWHLHLLYTNSYWLRFCQEVLDMHLHHHPGTGGSAERAKFDGWYADTLNSYRRCFDTEPPSELWPAAGTQLKAFTAHQRVNIRRCWIVRKPWHLGVSI